MFDREPTVVDFRFAALTWEVNRIYDSLTEAEKEFLLDVYITYPSYVRGQPGSEEKMVEYLDAIDVYERVEEQEAIRPFDTRQELALFAVGSPHSSHILGQPVVQTTNRQELERTMKAMTDQILARFGNIPDETAIRQSERDRLLREVERVFGPGGLEKFVRETSQQHIQIAQMGRAAISGMEELHRNMTAPGKEFLKDKVRQINMDEEKLVEPSEDEQSEEEISSDEDEAATPVRQADRIRQQRREEEDEDRRNQALARQKLLGQSAQVQELAQRDQSSGLRLDENTGQILKEMGREQIVSMAEMAEVLRKTQGELEAMRLIVHEIRAGQKEEIKGIETLVTKTINKESIFDISWSEIPTWFRLQYSKGLLNMCFQLAILPLRIPKLLVSKLIIRPARRFIQTVWSPLEIGIGFCVIALAIGGIMHVYYSDDYQAVRQILNSAPVEWIRKWSMVGASYGQKLVAPFMPSLQEMAATIQKAFIDLVITPMYEIVYLIIKSLQAYMVVGLNRFMATVPVVGRWWSPIDVPWPQSEAFKTLTEQIAKLVQ